MLTLIRDLKCKMGIHDWETIKVPVYMHYHLGEEVKKCRACRHAIFGLPYPHDHDKVDANGPETQNYRTLD